MIYNPPDNINRVFLLIDLSMLCKFQSIGPRQCILNSFVENERMSDELQIEKSIVYDTVLVDS